MPEPENTPLVRPIALPRHTLENNLVLAPMAGVSNLPFRLIARQAGASLVFTETVSAKGLVMGGRKTWRLLETSPRETPCAFLELKSGREATQDEIIAFCRESLAGFKAPKHVVFGELPKTSTGKIQKFVLREAARSL